MSTIAPLDVDSILLVNDRNQKRFDVLVEYLRQQSSAPAMAFIGAGVSVRSGYPTWAGLVQALVAAVDEGRHAEPTELAQLRLSQDLLWVSSRCQQLLGAKGSTNTYLSLLRRQFKPRRANNELLDSIVSLPFKAFATTNYDHSIEKAYKSVTGRKLETIQWCKEASQQLTESGSLAGGRPHCLHLHGSYRRPESIVLTERDYQNRYLGSPALIGGMERLFSRHVVVFIGFSLNDADLMSVLRLLTAKDDRDAPHYAFLPLSDADQSHKTEAEHARLMEKYRIAPIFYRMLTSEHLGLEYVLKRLAAHTTDGGRSRVAVQKQQEFRFNPKALKALLVSSTYSDDPNKGMFGGRAERNSRRLTAEVSRRDTTWFDIKLTVVSTDRRKPLQRSVTFYVHPTFPTRYYNIRVQSPKEVSFSMWAYGAFTVGAVTDRGRTALELDLALLEQAPREFRMR